MEGLAAASAVIAVVTAAKDVVEMLIKINDSLEQIKRNCENHAEQIQQIMQLLDVVKTALKPSGTDSARPELLDAVNTLKSNLAHCLKRCQNIQIPSGMIRGYWNKERIKKLLEGVKVAVTDFLHQFSMGSNIRLERTTSDNSDKLDKLLYMERREARPGVSSPHSSNPENQPPAVSSRQTKEYLIGKLHKLSNSLTSSTAHLLGSRMALSPTYPDRLASNTHRPHLPNATNGLLDAIAKTERILETYHADSAADSARSLDNLSVALMDVGLVEEAAEISSFSVRIYGHIEWSEPDSKFAIALHNYSHHLRASRKVLEAVEQAQRAVDIYHRLRGGMFDPGRAKTSGNLAACLRSAGRAEEALAAFDEAVRISSNLHLRDPDDEHLTADLAMLLSNRANHLLSFRYDEDALEDAQLSQEMYQQLCQMHYLPDQYTPEYADSLRVYSQALYHLCRYNKALFPARKAVDLWRELDATNPDVYSPKLGEGILGVVDILTKLGQTLNASDEIQDAVKIFRRLAGQSPDMYNRDYARSLHRTAHILTDQKREKQALRFLDDALRIYEQTRDFAAAAIVCDDKHICLTRLKCLEKARDASRAAISNWKQVPTSAKKESGLAASRRDLAATLYNLSAQPGLSEEFAVVPASEAVQLLLSLLAGSPNDIILRRKFVTASTSLSLFHSDLGNHHRALDYAKAAVKVGVSLEDGDRPLLKRAWTRLSFCHNALGAQKRADSAQEEANGI
ncbi:hypothetical protein B0H15DRAFT_427518 [Mycena belliarum]|uniref:Uncharacterized protein n=1 Tax=Mycena belliarum TaxID=1033014 RepID=A0AAD6TXJ6_9AGAR|nr:hypothetical protein B0H15DRAFT_427518 [Mycena belliae]